LSAREWQHLGEDTGSLYRGARLTQAVEWAAAHAEDLDVLESAFEDAPTKVYGHHHQPD
jgi:hypothetical protein